MSDAVWGKIGETYALDFLKRQGYKIIFRNFRNRFGEIDIVARDSDTLCFVEVKTRGSDRYGLPQEAVAKSKQRRLIKLALSFLKEKDLLDKKARFDVVSVRYSDKGSQPQLELIKNAFELDEEPDND
ncbi:MAG: YraN family protein [Candidatus Omnitrophica bacterium]|nr:YraN family protein [Candidatus Omnitrophota bacterium]